MPAAGRGSFVRRGARCGGSRVVFPVRRLGRSQGRAAGEEGVVVDDVV